MGKIHTQSLQGKRGWFLFGIFFVGAGVREVELAAVITPNRETTSVHKVCRIVQSILRLVLSGSKSHLRILLTIAVASTSIKSAYGRN